MRYPAVEFTTGVLFVLLYLKYGLNPLFGVNAVFASILLVVAFIDFDHKVIPNIISVPGMIMGLVLSFWILPISPLTSLLGLLVGGGLFYLVAFISKGGMGGGDIKLIAMIGSFLGWRGSLFTILASALLGSVVGISLMMFHMKGRKDTVPFGPFLSCGAVLFMLYGDELIQWYLDLLS